MCVFGYDHSVKLNRGHQFHKGPAQVILYDINFIEIQTLSKPKCHLVNE